MIYQYFFEVSIVWLIFLIIYKFLLGYETFFQKNRVYLISAVMIGLLLPLVRLLPFSFQTDILPVTGLYILEDGLSITGLNNVVSDNPGINWSVIILMFYLAGVLLGVSRLIYGLNKIYKLRSEALVVSKNGYTLVVTNTFHLPFSFFKMVFVNRDMLEHKAIKEILKHEMTHVKHAHSFDVFFLELVTIFFWWNPLIYLYKHAIKETHEFLADQLACDTGSKAGYSRLLLSQDESSVQLALTHQFFQSHLKNRIKMLDKSNSSNFRLFKYLIVIPVALLMIIIFSASSDFHDHHSIPEELIVKLDKSMDQNLFDNGINPTGETNVVQLYSSLKKEFPKYSSYIETQLVRKAKEYGYDLGFDHHENGKYCISQSRTEISFPERIHSIVKADSIPEKGRAELFKVVEQMPRFIGCDYGDMSNEEAVQCSNQKLIEYVGEHLVYPENAKKEGLEGMVVIRFSVLKTGKVDDVNILRDIGKGCGEAGASVIRNMNDDGIKWIPGQQRGKKVNVQFTLPIKFKLPDVPPTPEAPPAAPAPPKPPSVNEGGLKSKRTAAPQSADEPKAKKVHNSQSGISPPPPPPPGDVIENEVDEMPRFPGCEDERLSGMEQDNCSKGKLLNYIFSNIKYPAEARKSGIQGMVVVQFVVEKDGSISNSKILRDIGGGCGKESLRVVDSMNDMKEKWVPGKKEGKITRVAYTLPVKFALGNDKSGKKARENFMKGK